MCCSDLLSLNGYRDHGYEDDGSMNGCIRRYSERILFTGLASAACRALYPTVIHAMNKEMMIARIKTPAPSGILNSKLLSQSLITYHAIGAATAKAIAIRMVNSLENK